MRHQSPEVCVWGGEFRPMSPHQPLSQVGTIESLGSQKVVFPELWYRKKGGLKLWRGWVMGRGPQSLGLGDNEVNDCRNRWGCAEDLE